MSTLALFAALGGSAYAAIRITGAQIAPHTITALQVKHHTLTSSLFKPGQSTGAKGNPGINAIASTTTLTRSGQTTDSSPTTSAWHQLEAFPTFTKASAATHLLVRVNGEGGGSTASEAGNGAICTYQVRIDGLPSDGSTAASPFVNDAGMAYIHFIDNAQAALPATASGYQSGSYVIDADFGALTTGTHTLTIWDSGNAAACSGDPNNWHEQVLIEELSTTS